MRTATAAFVAVGIGMSIAIIGTDRLAAQEPRDIRPARLILKDFDSVAMPSFSDGSDPESVDVTIPGGSAWTLNNAGTRWLYKDKLGTADGVTRVIVRNDSAKVPGQLRFTVKGVGPSPFEIPSDDAARLHAILGTGPGECASRFFNGPGGARPNCNGDSDRLTCR